MTPDFSVLRNACQNGDNSEVPLYEHIVDLPIILEVMGVKDDPSRGFLESVKITVEFFRQMGYHYCPFELRPRFAPTIRHRPAQADPGDRSWRSWTDEADGFIRDYKDLRDPAYWPEPEDAFDFDSFEEAGRLLPEGMKFVGGASGGPFEHASFLMGLEPLCYRLCDDEGFASELFGNIGRTLEYVAERLCGLDCLGIYRFGDDMGYKGATMLSPDTLRRHVFPYQKRVVAKARAAGKPFLLHSCGNLTEVMDDLIDDVGIDAKHSFEDVIMPIEECKRLWGGRIALFGGIDVDLMCRADEKAVAARTYEVLKACGAKGYAAGSGNTITSYMPVKNYLAMVRAVNDFNGRR